jgi:hypothetical protein
MLKKKLPQSEPVVVNDAPISKHALLSKKRILLGLLFAVALLGVGGSYYFYQKYSAMKADPNIEAQRQSVKLIADLGKLMELPTGETPTIATISDKEKLNTQTFFQNAQNGDIIFAYTTAMKAILYRPSTNKIINVAPISLAQTPEPAQNADIQTPLRISYYNGTAVVGLTGTAEIAVKQKYPDAQTVSLTNASNKNYTKTLVVDLSGKHQQEAEAVATLLNGTVGLLPSTEKKPEADLLVITGK